MRHVYLEVWKISDDYMTVKEGQRDIGVRTHVDEELNYEIVVKLLEGISNFSIEDTEQENR